MLREVCLLAYDLCDFHASRSGNTRFSGSRMLREVCLLAYDMCEFHASRSGNTRFSGSRMLRDVCVLDYVLCVIYLTSRDAKSTALQPIGPCNFSCPPAGRL